VYDGTRNIAEIAPGIQTKVKKPNTGSVLSARDETSKLLFRPYAIKTIDKVVVFGGAIGSLRKSSTIIDLKSEIPNITFSNHSSHSYDIMYIGRSIGSVASGTILRLDNYGEGFRVNTTIGLLDTEINKVSNILLHNKNMSHLDIGVTYGF